MCGSDQAIVTKGSKSSSGVVPEATEDNFRPNLPVDAIINLDHGDPTIFESYWRKLGNACTVTFTGYQSLSYFSNPKNLCWFLEPKLEEEIKNLHNVVGNATVEGYHIVVGTGSSQLIQAVLYALSDPLNEPKPINVVSATPYYSSYPEVTDFVRSGLYKWAGDAHKFDKDGPYIEMVTSPNNPDGVIREPVVNRAQGTLVHDLAYYWPQYTPITGPADYDIMLFTVSKCTGHAGSRIGWALVKDVDVARKMVKFIEINTIGVSKESQQRAAKILEVISDSCSQTVRTPELDNFFEYGQHHLTERWRKLREIAKRNGLFTLPKFPLQYCNFTGDFTKAHPAFAWMKCKEDVDCEKLFRGHKILTRSGKRFGSDQKYVRISMMSRDEEFDLFVQRFSTIYGIANGN